MCSERYPQDLAVLLRAFETSGWKEVIAQAASNRYSSRQLALRAAADDAMEKGQVARGKVLWLLTDVCAMRLLPLRKKAPFEPTPVSHSFRSVVPDDFTDTDIAFFAAIVDAVDDNRLKARLCDLVWLMGRHCKKEFALKAIDAYRCLPFNTQEERDCWSRAICLANQLKRGAGARLQEMEASAFNAFDGAKSDDVFFCLKLANFMKENDLGCSRNADVARRLEALARELDGYTARQYFSAAAKWYKSASKVAEMKAATAECLAQEAVAQTKLESPDYITAVNLCEQAIQTCLDVPIRERPKYRVDEKIAELRVLLNEFGKKSLGNMGVVQTPCIDITDTVAMVRKSISGKSAKDALLAFVHLHGAINVEELRNNALERMREHPLQFLFPATVISSDGRVIAKRSAGGGKAIHAAMLDDYGCMVGCFVLSGIVPALEVLLLEHRLKEADFIELASNSSFVPQDRAGLWGRALFAGYERDFVIAVHLLVPQIEHLVREHLKQEGAATANFDNKSGIQTENGLSRLLDLPEAEQVFGKSLSFELKALFCDPLGSNLRNTLAHGLLDEEGCNSPFAIYAWWLALRLTVMHSTNPAVWQQESEGE